MTAVAAMPGGWVSSKGQSFGLTFQNDGNVRSTICAGHNSSWGWVVVQLLRFARSTSTNSLSFMSIKGTFKIVRGGRHPIKLGRNIGGHPAFSTLKKERDSTGSKKKDHWATCDTFRFLSQAQKSTITCLQNCKRKTVCSKIYFILESGKSTKRNGNVNIKTKTVSVAAAVVVSGTTVRPSLHSY